MELKDMLVIVRHPQVGDAENGKAICGKIALRVAENEGPVCLYHDAVKMLHANTAYAAEFKKLDKQISERVVEVVCSIPGSIPRMMAHTVAMFSSKKWSIFKDRGEALKYLNLMGYSITEPEIEKAEDVSVKILEHDAPS